MSPPSFIVAVPLLAILAAATITDLRRQRIPNALSLGGAALGFVTNAITFGPHGVFLALLGWVVCLACFLPLYSLGGMAAGDVKLMATVGAFLGPLNGVLALLLTLVAGAATAASCLAWHNLMSRVGTVPRGTSRHLGSVSVRARTSALDKIPYAAAIALGTGAVVLQPRWLSAVLGAIV